MVWKTCFVRDYDEDWEKSKQAAVADYRQMVDEYDRMQKAQGRYKEVTWRNDRKAWSAGAV